MPYSPQFVTSYGLSVTRVICNGANGVQRGLVLPGVLENRQSALTLSFVRFHLHNMLGRPEMCNHRLIRRPKVAKGLMRYWQRQEFGGMRWRMTQMETQHLLLSGTLTNRAAVSCCWLIVRSTLRETPREAKAQSSVNSRKC
mmetsp:Transcript_22313/g.68680  ORF Transcript_22313/g.68680 Transcript_22313/m.68680 type:complete len:142 (-) Transcript_22313:326-751(-)